MTAVLQKIYSNSGITPDDQKRILDSHEKIIIKKGDFLLKEGEIANEYYCLESGLIRSFAISSDGKEVTTGFFSPGEIVIEVASMFLRLPTSENIQTLTDCTCWRISFDTFQELFHTIDGFTEWGRTWMSGALFTSKQRSLSMITDSATDRYLALQREQPEIIQQAPLKYIASYLGITDTSLSRIRNELGKR